MSEDKAREGVQWLEVGSYLHLQPDIPNRENRYQVMVHGWEEGRFILTSMPSTEGAAETFQVGSEWVARFVFSGKAFGFKIEVSKVQFDPRPLLFFRYPESIEAVDIRKHKRITTFIIGSVSRLTETSEVLETVECVVRDLSRGGCMIDAKTELSTGEKVKLSFVLPNGERLESVPCEVRNVRRCVDRQFEGGVMFAEDADQKGVVDAFFDHISQSER